MVDPDVHVFWTLMLYTWPYVCIPLAFSVDGKLRARWHLEDVSRPASGYRFKGANMQMVLTSRAKAGPKAQGRSRGLECTNFWPVSVIGPTVFVFAAEWSSGAVSVLLVCTPFVFLTLVSLTLNQVTILVSLLTSPVVSLIFGVINRGPGDRVVRSMLWSQAFIVLTAVSLTWSVHGVITLRKILVADSTAAAADPSVAEDDGLSNANATAGVSCHEPQQARALQTNFSPEACIIKAAEAILAGSPGSATDEDAALASLATTVAQARSIDTPVLQTEKSLRAWSKVILHQGEVERDIRETHRWGVLGEKLISMNGGMPFVVGIIQGILLATSQLEESDAYGSGPIGATFVVSLVAFAASIAVSTVLLIRMLTLIRRASHGLADAALKTDKAMEKFMDLRSWGSLRHGEVGCLTHVAAGRGMVRALEFLVLNGANPSAVDSNGKTPLQIARESGMQEAHAYLEALIGGGQQGDIRCANSPLPDKVRQRMRITQQLRPLGQHAGDGPGGAEDEGGGREATSTHRWKGVRKVAGMAVRWGGKPDNAFARRKRGRVGVEPRVAGIVSPGQPPAKPSTELAASLSISRQEADGGGVLAPGPSSTPTPPTDGDGNESRLQNLAAAEGHPPRAKTPAIGDGGSGAGQETSSRSETEQRRAVRRRPSDTLSGEDIISPDGILSPDGRDLTGGNDGDVASGGYPADKPGRRRASSDSRRKGKAGGREGGRGEANAGAGGDVGDTVTYPQDDRRGERTEEDDAASSSQRLHELVRSAENAPTPTATIRSRRPSFSKLLSTTLPRLLRRRSLSGEEGHAGCAGESGISPRRSSVQLAPTASEEAYLRPPATFQRPISAVRAISTLKSAAAAAALARRAADGCANIVYSPTQAVLNITWALRRLRPLGTPRERRAAFEDLRKSSPFHIPQMYLLAFVDLAALGEIPRRTGDHFLGHGSKKRPVSVHELMARADRQREDPVVVYVSHRWLEPDFKNPDNHSKARFYQVCYLVQKLAKRMGRKPCDFYLWIDYACINQQNPTADRLALPCVLDSCDVMVYVEDDEYWEQALARTEHFLFHKLRRLRPPANGASSYEEDVFSLSADGERLTQRTYAETRAKFMHNPAKGSLTTETDRLYLWTLVLALEYEDAYTLTLNPKLRLTQLGQEEAGFMKLLRETISVNSGGGGGGNNVCSKLAAADPEPSAPLAATAAEISDGGVGDTPRGGGGRRGGPGISDEFRGGDEGEGEGEDDGIDGGRNCCDGEGKVEANLGWAGGGSGCGDDDSSRPEDGVARPGGEGGLWGDSLEGGGGRHGTRSGCRSGGGGGRSSGGDGRRSEPGSRERLFLRPVADGGGVDWEVEGGDDRVGEGRSRTSTVRGTGDIETGGADGVL